jgi:hypothetical protein
MVLILGAASASLTRLTKHRFLGSPSEFVIRWVNRVRLKICISNKLPEDTCLNFFGLLEQNTIGWVAYEQHECNFLQF